MYLLIFLFRYLPSLGSDIFRSPAPHKTTATGIKIDFNNGEQIMYNKPTLSSQESQSHIGIVINRTCANFINLLLCYHRQINTITSIVIGAKQHWHSRQELQSYKVSVRNPTCAPAIQVDIDRVQFLLVVFCFCFYVARALRPMSPVLKSGPQRDTKMISITQWISHIKFPIHLPDF